MGYRLCAYLFFDFAPHFGAFGICVSFIPTGINRGSSRNQCFFPEKNHTKYVEKNHCYKKNSNQTKHPNNKSIVNVPFLGNSTSSCHPLRFVVWLTPSKEQVRSYQKALETSDIIHEANSRLDLLLNEMGVQQLMFVYVCIRFHLLAWQNGLFHNVSA